MCSSFFLAIIHHSSWLSFIILLGYHSSFFLAIIHHSSWLSFIILLGYHSSLLWPTIGCSLIYVTTPNKQTYQFIATMLQISQQSNK
jgi:fucose permease